MIEYFRIRFVRKGPWMPASVRSVCSCPGAHVHLVHPGIGAIKSGGRGHRWYRKPIAEIRGQRASADYVSIYGFPITRKQYDYLKRVKEWADQNVWPAEARPYEPVDLNKLPLRL